MFFDLFRSPLSTGAQQSRVPVNLSSNSQDQNDLIVNELYDEIIKPINSAEIDSESTDRSQKIISKVKELDIGDKQKILEKLRIKLNEYFNQKDGEIERIPDELMRRLLRAGFQARIDIFKNFQNSIDQQSNSSILPVNLEVEGVDKRSESLHSSIPTLLRRDNMLFDELEIDIEEQGLNFMLNKYCETNKYKINKQLLEMKNSYNPKDNIFFKNYLLKHLELIKLYEDGKKEMIKKFQERGVDKNLAIQKIDLYITKARKDCLDFLLANASNLQQFKINNSTKDQYLEKQKFELAEEISKLRLLLPPIFNPLRSQSQTSGEKAIYCFLLEQQRVLINSLQPPINRPSNLSSHRPSNPTLNSRNETRELY